MARGESSVLGIYFMVVWQKRGWVLLAGLLLVACTRGADRANGDRVTVVATTSPICDLAQQLARDDLDITCLLAPGQDPHTFAPTPSDRVAIDDADLILYGGYGLAPNIERLIQASPSTAPKVAVYELAVPEPLLARRIVARASHHHHAERHDLSHSDSAIDPHVWHDASNGIAIAQTIAAELMQVDPQASEAIRTNAEVLGAELMAIDRWIAAQIATIPVSQRKLVTTHAAFGYFAEAYGLEVAGALSGLSGIEKPAAGRVAAAIDLVRNTGVPAVFAESSTNREAIATVARNAGALVPEQVLYVEGPAGADSPAATYQDMLTSNTCAIVTGLGGECTNFTLLATE